MSDRPQVNAGSSGQRPRYARDPIGHLTTETSYSGGSAYTIQRKGFNAFGESLGQTVTLPAAEGALAGSYTLTHLYSSTTGLPLRDYYPASPLGTGQTTAALPAETLTRQYETGLDLPGTLGGLAQYGLHVDYTAWFQVARQTIGASAAYAYVTDSYDPHTGALTDTNVQNTAVSATPYDDTSYTYDPAGNTTSQTDVRTGTQTETQCYAYDTLDRLTAAWTTNGSPACSSGPSTGTGGTVGDGITGSAYWTSWAYDPLGNQTSQPSTRSPAAPIPSSATPTAPPASPTPSPRPPPPARPAPPPPHTATTADGNTTARTLPAGSQTLTWSDNGKLASDATSAGTSSYIYDADGNLLLQKNPGQVTVHLFGDTQQITLNTGTGAITGTRILALPGGGEVVRTGTGSAYTFEITDQHGTGLITLNSAVQSPAWRQYTPYGAPRGTAPPSWPDANAFLGKPADTPTGPDIIGARAYDPATSRFLSVDPIFHTSDPQTMAGYAYAANNPATNSDPSGLCMQTWCGNEPVSGGGGTATSQPTQGPACPDTESGCPGYTPPLDHPGTTTTTTRTTARGSPQEPSPAQIRQFISQLDYIDQMAQSIQGQYGGNAACTASRLSNLGACPYNVTSAQYGLLASRITWQQLVIQEAAFLLPAAGSAAAAWVTGGEAVTEGLTSTSTTVGGALRAGTEIPKLNVADLITSTAKTGAQEVLKDPGSLQDVGNQFVKQALVLPKGTPAAIVNADYGNVLLVTVTIVAIIQKLAGD